jgi:hypothetical protein
VPRAIGDLLIALRGAGAAVSAPVCAACGKQLRTLQRRGEDWYCTSCSLRPNTCAGCGRRQRIATRDRAALRTSGLITDPDNLEVWLNCGRYRPVDTRTPDGPICATCPALVAAACSICGECQPCGTSRITGQLRELHARAVWHDCPTCSDPSYPHPGKCVRCRINQRLNEIPGPPSASASSGTAGVAAQHRYRPTPDHRHAVAKEEVRRACTGRARCRSPRLDTRSARRTSRQSDQTLAAQTNPEQRKVLHRYTVWHLTRRLRQRNNDHATTI